MMKKPYLEISVSDVVKEAGVARASFYRNYSSVNDVMNDIMNEIATKISENLQAVILGNDERKWRDFLFGLFYRLPNTDFAMMTQSFENAGILLSRMNAIIRELNQKLPSSTLNEKYAPYGKMGFITNIVKKWVDTGMKESPEEMVNYIMTFIISKE